jgi:TolB-like protein
MWPALVLMLLGPAAAPERAARDLRNALGVSTTAAVWDQDPAKPEAPACVRVANALVRQGVVMVTAGEPGGATVVVRCAVVDGQVQLMAAEISTGRTLAQVKAALEDAAVPTGAVLSGDLERVALGLAATLMKGLDALPGTLRYQRVAVVPFSEVGDAAKQARAGSVVALEMTRVFKDVYGVTVVERAVLDAVVRAQAGRLAAGEPQELGTMLGAQALVLGDVAPEGDRLLVRVRAVDASSGAVVAQASGAVARRDVVRMSSALLERSTGGNVMARSVVFPGWGQVFVGQPVRGVAWMVGVGALAATTLASLVGALAVTAVYLGMRPASGGAWPTPGDVAAASGPLRQAAAVLFVVGTAVAGVGLGVWALNVLDAAWAASG